jgi:hypothetical protein
MALEAPGTVSVSDEVRDGGVGIEVRSVARVQDARISGVQRGIVVGERGIAAIDGVRVDAGSVGIALQVGAWARVEHSRVSAPAPMAGVAPRTSFDNRLISPPSALPWLAVAGAAFLVLAVILQLVHRSRNRAVGLKEGPTGAWNTSS